MKKIQSSFTLLLLLVVLSIVSCTKDDDDSTTPVNPGISYFTKNQMYKDLKSAPQTLTVVAGTQQVVYGTQKTKLTFYPNSFKDKNGIAITNGSITLKLVEIYNPGDMIANRAPTTSNGKLLRSGGEIYLKAYRNGEEVFANTYGVGFVQPSASAQTMRLFYGDNNNEDSIINWVGAPANIGTTVNGTTTVDSGMLNDIYYDFDSCANFNWINCDFFYNSTSPLTNVNVVMPDTSFNSNNTLVFLYFPAINSAASTNLYNWGIHAFSLSNSYYVPVGMNVHFVSITNKNGSYYYAELLNQTITSSMSVNVSPQPQTLAYIQNKLSQL